MTDPASLQKADLTPPDGLLPVKPRGKHEIEAAGGWVVACGAYGEYGCMPTEVRDFIVAQLNAILDEAEARPSPTEEPRS